MPAMSPTSIAVLRFLNTHGLSYRAAVNAGVTGLQKNNLDNLARMGYVAIDSTAPDQKRYSITTKGRAKLQKESPAAAGAMQGAAAMLSSVEIEALVMHTVRKASIRLELSEISRRTSLPDYLLRPAVIALVQRGDINATATLPATYKANHKRTTVNPVARARDRANQFRGTNGYTCPELARNPGLSAERFAAFDLPSRVGNWLHYPDGRKEPFPTQQPANANPYAETSLG